jgi:hypothetical protein
MKGKPENPFLTRSRKEREEGQDRKALTTKPKIRPHATPQRRNVKTKNPKIVWWTSALGI